MKRLSLLAGIGSGFILLALVALCLTSAWQHSFAGSSTLNVFATFFVLAFFAGLIKLQDGALRVDLNNVAGRLIFDNAKRYLLDVGIERNGQMLKFDIEQAKGTMSYLRSEQDLAVGQSTYLMPLVKNQNDAGSTTPLSNLINLQDIFIATQVSVMAGIYTDSTKKNALLYSYGNQIAFSTSGAGVGLWNLWNAKINLLNNGVKVVPSFPVLRSYFVPQAQAVADLYYDGTTVQQDQINLSTDTWNALEPNWIIDGAGNMECSILMKGGPAAIQANSFICLQYYGLLLQNVTAVNA